MYKKPFNKVVVFVSIVALLMISISLSPHNLSYAFLVFDLGGTTPEDQSITSSKSSYQGSYCYAPPNTTIINSCNSGDLSSSENTGLNIYE